MRGESAKGGRGSMRESGGETNFKQPYRLINNKRVACSSDHNFGYMNNNPEEMYNQDNEVAKINGIEGHD